MTTPSLNSKPRQQVPLKWITSLIAAVAIGAGGHAGYTVSVSHEQQENHRSQAAKIAVLESEVASLRDDIRRMSDKLDRLIERTHK